MPLAGRAREHRDAVCAAAGVGQQVPEPRAHRLADEMLLRRRDGAALPALPERLEQGTEHGLEGLFDAEKCERLVELQPDHLGLDIVERVE